MVNNEYGAMKSALLCNPTYMYYQPINQICKKEMDAGKTFDKEGGKRELKAMAEAIASQGIVTYFVPPEYDCPGQPFTRDLGFMSPAGALLGKFQWDTRTNEIEATRDYLERNDMPIAGIVSSGVLEGGDCHFLDASTLIIGNGRSTDEGSQNAVEILKEKGYEYDLVRVDIPREFHHLDAIFVIVGERICVACSAALSKEFIHLLFDRGFKIIDVPIEESRVVGSNVVSLGRDVILSSRRGEQLNQRLRALGFTVLDPDLSMLNGQGGGPRCLTFPLERENIYE